MELAPLFEHYHDAFIAGYADQLSSVQWQAVNAIRRCRTSASGELQVRCTACDQQESQPLSCGHRSCPKCQNHEATQWLERQRGKLLPVEYFMATFTLPAELRPLARRHQGEIYPMLFACAVSTLKDFGLNPQKLGVEMGMTAVLHTHTRRLDYHPHVHIVVPGGGIDARRRQWKKVKGKFLFNEFALAKVFRARILSALNAEKLPIPAGMRARWVVDCAHVGSGKPALEYLSRYLYRGVISEKNIIANQDGNVTFRYVESSTGQTQTRTLKGEDFLWLVLQHVLPKGFRRARDYGFLHGNAKKRLLLVQFVLHVVIQIKATRPRPVFKCRSCQSPVCIIALIRTSRQSG